MLWCERGRQWFGGVWSPGAGDRWVSVPLRQVAVLALPGQASRFDYADVDPAAHRLWLAHLGDSTVVEVDLVSRRVVRTIPDMANVTGVIVVPALHRVFVSTPGTGQVVTLDEDNGTVLARAAAGSYPDGLAYVCGSATSPVVSRPCSTR